MKIIKYTLICLAVTLAACLFNGCAYEKPYKNNNTFQSDEDAQNGGK